MIYISILESLAIALMTFFNFAFLLKHQGILLFLLLGLFATWDNYFHKYKRQNLIISIITSGILSLLCVVSTATSANLIQLIFVFLGSAVSFFNLLILFSNTSLTGAGTCKDTKEKRFFYIPFALIICIDLFLLVGTQYPGVVDPDCTVVLNQIFGISQYTNQHSVYVTYLLKLCIYLGKMLFGTTEAGLFIFAILEIIFISFVFSFALYTLRKVGINIYAWSMIAIWIIFVPFNISYSFFISKDEIFAGAMLLLTTCIVRIFNDKIKHSMRDRVLLCLSFLAICILRGNGLYIGIVWMLFAVIYLVKIKEQKLAVMICFTLLVSLILTKPVLRMMNVQSNKDCLESLAIPIQQISKVIRDEYDLTQDEADLISNVSDISKIGEVYRADWVDFEKDLIRTCDGIDYLESHKREFIKLYFDLGKRHPKAYISAWYYEIQSYLIPRDAKFVFVKGISEDSKELVQGTVLSQSLLNLFDKYCASFLYAPVVKVFTCIGMYMWMNILLFASAIIKKDRSRLLVTLPTLLLLVTLLIAAPVDGEFRYIYPGILAMIMGIV